jgi:hypothetical protein
MKTVWIRSTKTSNKPDPPAPEELAADLRANQGQHTVFADHMIRAIHGKSRYGEAAERITFDSLISKSQAAFTLLLYENGYKNWVWASRNDLGSASDASADANTDSSDGTCPTHGFTERGREGLPSRNGGWSLEGMKKYNELHKRVTEDQISDAGAFRKAEDREHREAKRSKGRKRKRGNADQMIILTISDDLGELMQSTNSEVLAIQL